MAIIEMHTKKGTHYRAYFKWKGKQVSKVFSSKRQAKIWEVEEKKRLQLEETLGPILMYSQAVKQYIADAGSRFGHNAVREKARHLRDFADYLGGDVSIAGITATQGKSFLASMQKEHGNKSANRRLQNLKAMWNWHKEALLYNPWRYVPPYPEEAFIKYVPPPQDVGAVLHLAEEWEHDFLLTLLSTGARVGEIFNLMWEDINLERNTLALWTKKRRGGNREARLTPISPRLRTVLDKLKGDTESPQGYVFINPLTGSKYHNRQPSVRYMLKRLCKAAEVKEFGFHALRHFVASQLASSQQANIVEIQQLLGHKRTTTTDLYLRSMSSSISHLGIVIDNILPEEQE